MSRVNGDLPSPPASAVLSRPPHTGGVLLHHSYFIFFLWLWTCEILQLLSFWRPCHCAWALSRGIWVGAARRLTGPRGCSPAGRSLSLLQERSGVDSPRQRARAGPRPPARLYHQHQDQAELPGLTLSLQGGPHPGKGGRVPRCRKPARAAVRADHSERAGSLNQRHPMFPAPEMVSWNTFFYFPLKTFYFVLGYS